MTIVRKFQMPINVHSASVTKSKEPAVTDVDIPEINTNFMDNLFEDPSFLNRFDASYEKTNLMGLDDGNQSLSDARASEGMINFDFLPKTDR